MKGNLREVKTPPCSVAIFTTVGRMGSILHMHIEVVSHKKHEMRAGFSGLNDLLTLSSLLVYENVLVELFLIFIRKVVLS